ncbi:MAG: sensor histidine kinase KdpD [Planctomycetes bacterium]|nr:sensor histidine kinase KdpD [Planctomycetota bacterium]
MNDDRPSPDELLARVQADEGRRQRGKLKIFFGYAAGVGKTYAMLQAARREQAAGVEVVVGYVEPHGRSETESLLAGLEAIPTRQIEYRGVTLREFYLDAALARHPALLLVDELAHTNAEGSRHAKRWQDVAELLEAGINVYTTLNVQHVESLNDVIAQISGIAIRETLPDSVFEQADDLELIDITPEELIERLHAGKVYIPHQAQRALGNFFQRSNLVALRELSLRQAANRLRRDVDEARQAKSATNPWAASERLLVCIGPSPTSAKLIRTAKRMAAAFGADWLAVAVQTPGETASSESHQQRIAGHLRLAEQLGAETHTLVGENVAQTVLDHARSRNVTKIVVGKTAVPRWKRLLRHSVVDQLLESSGEIDIYVIQGESEGPTRGQPPATRLPFEGKQYLATAAVIAICGGLAWIFHASQLAEANIVMAFLLGVAFVAARFGRWPAVVASIASVLIFDFFFVPPHLTFSVHDAQYFLTFAVMLGIGLFISSLTSRLREQLQSSQQQVNRTAALYRFTRQLSQIAGVEFLIRTAGQQLREVFDGEIVIYLRQTNGPAKLRFGEETNIAGQEVNSVVAQWVAEHDQTAGAGTDTLPNATALFVPLIGSQRTIGALGIKPHDPGRLLDPEQRRLLESCASLIALSIERDQSVLSAEESQLQAQAEQMRSSLLSSVSHDLRTPLAAIGGAASSLLEGSASSDGDDSRKELLTGICDEAKRLTRLVDNLLDITRLESGSIRLNKQWHVLEELVGSALVQLRRELTEHQVRVEIPDNLRLLSLDGILIEQLFANLLENAIRYTPPGTCITITAKESPHRVLVRVSDNGPGFPPGTENQVFEKFFRGGSSTPDSRRGVGLGLAICKSIVQAHGGQITAGNRAEGGAEFAISLPCEEKPPQITLDEASVS